MRCTLEGLDLSLRAAKIEQALQKVEGLEHVSVNFATKTVDISERHLEEARQVVARVEPDVFLRVQNEQPPAKEKAMTGKGQRHRLLLAGVLFLIGLLYHEFLHNTPSSWLEYAVLIPAYLLVGWPVVAAAFKKIARGQLFDENFLMTVATFGAIAIHQLTEAVGVMLFYAVGLYFQDKAIRRSRRSITALLDIQPDYANLKAASGVKRLKPEEVAVGEVILVKPGEKVPLDGEVIEGVSTVDTSALTGEAVPRTVRVGETVLAGMINGHGLLTVRVTKPFSESSVARILHLVEKAGERKAPVEQFITVFAHYYTPIVVGIAAAIALLPPLFLPGATFSQWFYRALVLLVISCPCALMISIPLSYFGGIGMASRRGVLVKGANYLDALTQLETVVFDKTGTLTKGIFRVTKVVPKNGYSAEKLLALAAGAEIYSNHPIALSIRAAYGREIPPDEVTEYREIPAHGISAVVGGQNVLTGNDRLMHRENIPHEDCNVEGTAVYLAINGTYAGYIVISDELKDGAAEVIKSLRALGVARIVMLTGDEESVARQVAEELGLDGYYAELLPEDKVARVETMLTNGSVEGPGKLAFVGDGVNDAPVITRADVGVAMGGLGRDAAMEAADVVLMDDSPAKLAEALAIAKRTRSIVRQNICLALGVKIFFILLGSLGIASIWEAVFADVGVTLLAVLNATRGYKQ